MSIQITKTPEECISKLKEGFCNKDTLRIDIDEVVVPHGFQVAKKNGGKDYVYFICHLSGKGREKPEADKQRNKSSKKNKYLISSESFPYFFRLSFSYCLFME